MAKTQPDQSTSTERLKALIERAVYPIAAALNCPAHPWHDSDDARKWLLDAAAAGERCVDHPKVTARVRGADGRLRCAHPDHNSLALDEKEPGRG